MLCVTVGQIHHEHRRRLALTDPQLYPEQRKQQTHHHHAPHREIKFAFIAHLPHIQDPLCDQQKKRSDDKEIAQCRENILEKPLDELKPGSDDFKELQDLFNKRKELIKILCEGVNNYAG